jgi:hypothetical protein
MTRRFLKNFNQSTGIFGLDSHVEFQIVAKSQA